MQYEQLQYEQSDHCTLYRCTLYRSGSNIYLGEKHVQPGKKEVALPVGAHRPILQLCYKKGLECYYLQYLLDITGIIAVDMTRRYRYWRCLHHW